MAEVAREPVPSKRTTLAEKIAKDVVNADPSILSLIVLDQMDGSKILAVARSPGLPEESHANPALVHKFGIAASIVWGAAENASSLMGRREYVIGAFKEQMVLLIGVQEYGMLLALRLARSTNAEHLYGKIASLLGTG